MKNILVIGGTGTISSPIVSLLAKNPDYCVSVLNRGHKNNLLPENVESIICDYHDTEGMAAVLSTHNFDVVINFILFMPEQAKRDVELFRGKVSQYIFISTVASRNHELTCLIDETSEAGNRFSAYGTNKGLAEDVFLGSDDFPVTIVRPTQTYSDHRFPLSVKGKEYWPVVQRMLDGKEVIVHGDGQSVWASTHADDFARLFVSVVGNDMCVGEIYQIMNPATHTWDMVYLELARQLGISYNPVYISSQILKESTTYDLMTSIQGDKHFSNIYDVSKILALNPGFEFEVGLEEGVKRFLEYMEMNSQYRTLEPSFDVWCDSLIERYRLSIVDLMKDL